MNVDLDKDDMVNLVAGTSPGYSIMKHPLIEPYGNYHGGFNDSWSWNKYELRKLEEKTLFTIYKKCKNET